MSAQNKFEVGMEVECVENPLCIGITVGKNYRIIGFDDFGNPQVISDSGKPRFYLATRFRPGGEVVFKAGDEVEIVHADDAPMFRRTGYGADMALQKGKRASIREVCEHWVWLHNVPYAWPTAALKLIRPAAEQAREAWKVGDRVRVTWGNWGDFDGEISTCVKLKDGFIAVSEEHIVARLPAEESPVVPMTTGSMTQADLDQVLGRNEPETLRLMRPVDRAQYLARVQAQTTERLAVELRAKQLKDMARMEDSISGGYPILVGAYRAMCEGGAE